MIRPAPAALILLLLANTRLAHAQLIGPIPPAPIPPAAPSSGAPSTVEVKPPPNAPDAPSIIDLENGRLKPLATSADEVAVARYPFDDARRARIAASLQSRAADMDRFVIANLDRVLEAEAMAPKVRTAGDFDTLFKARDTVAALRFERPLDRLVRDGAITLEHKTRLDEAVRGYEAARKKQNDADAAGDPTRAAVLALRQTFDDASREPFASLTRQLALLANHLEAVTDSLALRPEQIIARRALAQQLLGTEDRQPQHGPARQQLIDTFWRDVLDLEQKRAALTAARAAATPKQPAP